MNRPGRLGSVRGGDASAVTRGCGTVAPLISSCDHSKPAQRRPAGATPAEGFLPDSAHAKKSSAHSSVSVKSFESELNCDWSAVCFYLRVLYEEQVAPVTYENR